MINFKFPLQPYQKYYITKYEELGFSKLIQMKEDRTTNSHYFTDTFLFWKVRRMYILNLGVKGLRPPRTCSLSTAVLCGRPFLFIEHVALRVNSPKKNIHMVRPWNTMISSKWYRKLPRQVHAHKALWLTFLNVDLTFGDEKTHCKMVFAARKFLVTWLRFHAHLLPVRS